MTVFESPELRRLFSTYSDTKAPGRDSIADHLSVLSMHEHLADPLIVATATDLAVFPGSGRPPEVQGFRVNIPGFTELTAVSHFGPAIASIVAIAEKGQDAIWRADAARLLEATERVAAVNGPELWRDSLAISAFRGREESIAAMTGYACDLAAAFLRRALDEPGYLSAAALRRDLLDAGIDKVMIATFGLYALDYTHRLIPWLERFSLEWEHVLFVVTGRQGRPTAGLSKSTTNLARILRIVSGDRLQLDRIFIAPTAPGFDRPEGEDLSGVVAAEEPIRWQVARVMSSAELAPIMYEGYPVFAEPPLYGDPLTDASTTVTEMPRIDGPDDWRTMFTRLRLSLEDPRQLLAAGVTDHIAEQLVAAGNDPVAVRVPGLDGELYPEK